MTSAAPSHPTHTEKKLLAPSTMAQSHIPHLSEPLKLGDLTLKNRNIMAPLTRNRCTPTNVPNDIVLEHYVQRARGGAGLIINEGTLISPQGTEWPHAPGIWSEDHVLAWKKVTDAVHEAGSYMFCQLWHVGRVAHPDMEEQKKSGKPVPAPSAIAAYGGKFRLLPGTPGYVTPTALEDPRTVVEEFRHAAMNAKRAGFDGVEFQSAGGYLPQQFLDYTVNQRQDEWGGSVENRSRFGLECVEALLGVWGPARVGVKVMPCGGYNDVGMPLPDTISTYTHFITQVASMKPAYVHFLQHTRVMDIPAKPTIKEIGEKSHDKPFMRAIPHDVIAVYGGLIKPPPSALEDHAEEHIRGPAMPKPQFDSQNPTPTRLFVDGELTSDRAEELIGRGLVDAAVFGRLWISNPDLQKRFENGLVLNTSVDVDTLYSGVDGDIRVGYTTYPETDGTKLLSQSQSAAENFLLVST